MEALLEKLIESPQLRLYADEILKFLQEESTRREEFYNLITPDDKAEFINGEMIFHSPVKIEHNRAGKWLLRLLDIFVDQRGLGYVGYEKLLITLTRNDYEPDLCFFTKAKSDQFVVGQMQFPAPDFIMEILSPSTESRDRGIKREDYAAHGVREYWLIDTNRQLVERYLLDGKVFFLAEVVTDGILVSEVVTGFAIPVQALFDEQENLLALQQILIG